MDTMARQGRLTDRSLCAGTSGGSLGALMAVSGIDNELALDFIIRLSKNETFKRDIDRGESVDPILSD
jgi:hypothetical protein